MSEPTVTSGVRALLGEPAAYVDDATADRILDAALAQFREFGMRRVSAEDIARAASVGRVTIYRRFGNKDGLISALLLREAAALFGEFDAATKGLRTPEEHLVEGFVAAMRFAREHPLIDSLLAREPETILPFLTIDAGPTIAVMRQFLVAQMEIAQRAGALRAFDPAPVAEIFVRAAISILLTPQSVIPLETEDDLRAAARKYFVPVLQLAL